jgi:hypothetical protein
LKRGFLFLYKEKKSLLYKSLAQETKQHYIKSIMQKLWDPVPQNQYFFNFQEKERGIAYKQKTSCP